MASTDEAPVQNKGNLPSGTTTGTADDSNAAGGIDGGRSVDKPDPGTTNVGVTNAMGVDGTPDTDGGLGNDDGVTGGSV